MENNNENQENEALNNEKPSTEEAEFENSDVDPGFDGHQQDEQLDGFEDERTGDIDVNTSIKELSEDKENDALNYKNDRENGGYNPNNI